MDQHGILQVEMNDANPFKKAERESRSLNLICVDIHYQYFPTELKDNRQQTIKHLFSL